MLALLPIVVVIVVVDGLVVSASPEMPFVEFPWVKNR